MTSKYAMALHEMVQLRANHSGTTGITSKAPPSNDLASGMRAGSLAVAYRLAQSEGVWLSGHVDLPFRIQGNLASRLGSRNAWSHLASQNLRDAPKQG
jgi:hypothetical protein